MGLNSCTCVNGENIRALDGSGQKWQKVVICDFEPYNVLNMRAYKITTGFVIFS